MNNLETSYFKAITVGDFLIELPKSTLPASIASDNGAYPFYCSSSVIKYCNTFIQDKPTVLMGTGGTASVNFGNDKFAYSTDTWAFRSSAEEELKTEYIYRLIQHKLSKIDYVAFEGSGLKHLRKNDIKKLRLRVPANKLVTNKILSILRNLDKAIEKTEALIEKYQQIKAGLMHDLFTRGIGPDGKLRPPRELAPELYQDTVIGWIPKEWYIKNLAELSSICSGVTLGSKNTSNQNIRVPYLRVANVQDGYLDFSDIKEILVNKSTFDSLRLQVGDVLMNEGGDYDKLGRGTVWKGEIDPCIHQNHVFRVRTNELILRHSFLAYWSQSIFGKKYFILSSKQSTNLASINSTQLKKFPVALPLLNEQIEIEKRVDAINGKISNLQCEQKKLLQQKSGLMHDLLTGKVPVPINTAEATNV